MSVPASEVPFQESSRRPSREVVTDAAAPELVIAVIGHIGSGTSFVATQLASILHGEGGDHSFDVTTLKARQVILEWAQANSRPLPSPGASDVQSVTAMQDLGDEMRLNSGDNAAVSRAIIRKIRTIRAQKQGQTPEPGLPVVPDGARRAYVIDSLRHPEEVELLRAVYQDAFFAIGVVAKDDVRKKRISEKLSGAGEAEAQQLMQRDANAPQRNGQKVADAFLLADYFVDNSHSRVIGIPERPNPDWRVPEDLSRFAKLVTHSEIVRPTVDETAMFHANGARLESACLSRQVGAALVNRAGEIIATGTNEVPKAGGGVYDDSDAEFGVLHDGRCAYSNKVCSNNVEQNAIIGKLLAAFPEIEQSRGRVVAETALRESPIGSLIEFSRAVHAEMDALLSAARSGVSTVGTRLFVTTFPCHYCARHIVSAGVDEVQYIEPYRKSRAIALHRDSIAGPTERVETPSKFKARQNAGVAMEKDGSQVIPPKVLFKPFTGVAPRLYRLAFMKDRDLKDDVTGDVRIGKPKWGVNWQLKRSSYVELEAALE